MEPYYASTRFAKLRPDGLLVDKRAIRLHALEFARTGDSRPDSLSLARLHKERKYEVLLQERCSNTVTLNSTIIGAARSMIIEEDWLKQWTSLRLPQAALKEAIITTMARNQDAISDIRAVRAAALSHNSEKADG